MSSGKDAALEAIMSQLGEFGKYQLRQHLLHLLTAFLAGVHMLSLSFTAPIPEHRCKVPDIDVSRISTDLAAYIPAGSESEHDHSCNVYKTPGNPNNGSVECHGPYIFNNTYYGSSWVIDFSLVCDRRWMRALLQSIYMVGVLCGAVTLGSMADSYGRKPIMYISAVLQLIFGLVCAFVDSYYLLSVGLFFYGAFGSGGAYVTGFVLSMELIGASKRTVCGTAFSFVFAVGIMIDAFWAWLIPGSHKILQVTYALHSLLMIGHWWFVDESIRWLWGKGKTKRALEIAANAIKVNGKTLIEIPPATTTLVLPDETDDMNDNPDAQFQNQRVSTIDPPTNRSLAVLTIKTTGLSIAAQEGNIKLPVNPHPHPPHSGMVDLFRHKHLRNRTLNMAYNWFANSLVYYGLNFNAGTLPGNPFLMNFLSGIAEVPGYIIVIMLLDKWGRRSLGSILVFCGGLACVIIAFLENGTVVITIAMLAKVAVAASFGICYNYTAELFPTVIRNSVVGITTMAARGAGMLAPEIILLDEVGKSVPTIIFGGIAILAAFLALFLPETLNTEMPQTIDDGENFGKGDTAFVTFCNFCKGKNVKKTQSQITVRAGLRGKPKDS